ncbi:FadR/GntR family transcriptional regulator [Microbacterium marinilacus]|uniref:FadR/GntR family transcriptional regulator n=1 Tax=Microbacterium marinilacus TaxID=415209 RepID=A0ABP7BDN2_9MICO|nr:FCD domain-containing protein [Microbacterium marinilacus]MBY0689408.1 FCD domain-containing protein [Microbacterium marinilacus]
MSTTRAEEISRVLADRIVEGTIAPGERLPSEARLVDEFGASRPVVREALHRLQSRGLVRTRVGSGSYALTPPAPTSGDDWLSARDDSERSELHAFRIAVEAEAAAHAARAATPEATAEIDAALAALERAQLPVETVEADFAFHRAIAAASGNRYLLAALDRMGARVIVLPPARISDAQRDAAEAAAVLAEHRSVATAIRLADPLAASAAMRAHLTASTARRAAR